MHILKSLCQTTQRGWGSTRERIHKASVNGFLGWTCKTWKKQQNMIMMRSMGREVCAGGEEKDGTNLTAHHFPVTSRPAFLQSHPSWMTIAPRFAYPKMLPEFCLPSTSKRLENIDIYWQNPEAWQNSIWDIALSIFSPFSLFTRTRYWVHIEVLIVLLRQSHGTAWFLGCVIIVPSCQLSNDTDFN